MEGKKNPLHAVKRVSTTRWSSHSAALNVVLKFHNAVLKTLNQIKDSEESADVVVGASCSGLISYLTSQRFLLTALLFKTIFDILEPVTRQLQSQDMDMLMATNILNNVIHRIKELRNDDAFKRLLKITDEFTENSVVDFLPLVSSRPKRVPRKSGELSQDEIISCPMKKFKIDTYNIIIDILLAELSGRFESTNIGPLKDLSLLSSRRIREVQNNPHIVPCDAFDALCTMYTQIDKNTLLTEYIEFCKHFTEIENSIVLPKYLNTNVIVDYEDSLELDAYSYDGMDKDSAQIGNHNIASTRELFNLFCLAKLANIFPNLYLVLKLAVTLPVTSCSVERTFSKLKLIKTKLRTTMSQDRLESLMKISCEQDIIINNENVILLFAAKSSVLTKCLIY
ncbi:uncharacterized protein LOC132952868 [Metopolophium dirhodum]|uniref:uncharacterized protein LOC132952868 n=1 Tax=Metopolophium dirhodum TaxID=44670 RepID=UPI002990831C|nr:uncharacterized protein LOC132952868 [Metopolophium dirhodum]